MNIVLLPCEEVLEDDDCMIWSNGKVVNQCKEFYYFKIRTLVGMEISITPSIDDEIYWTLEEIKDKEKILKLWSYSWSQRENFKDILEQDRRKVLKWN
jgi:hypothetical protein